MARGVSTQAASDGNEGRFLMCDRVLDIFYIFLRGSLILQVHFAINPLKAAVLSETTRTKQGLHL